jgi:hypothetical protein
MTIHLTTRRSSDADLIAQDYLLPFVRCTSGLRLSILGNEITLHGTDGALDQFARWHAVNRSRMLALIEHARLAP